MEFLEFSQEPQDLMFFFPGSYFWGYSEGFSIVESCMFAGKDWHFDAYKFCNPESNIFHVDNLLVDFSTIISAQTEGHAATTSLQVFKKRKAVESERPERVVKKLDREQPGDRDPLPNEVQQKAVGSLKSKLHVHGPADGNSDIADTNMVEERQRLASPPATRGTGNSRVTSTREFDISDDETPLTGTGSWDHDRVFQLQQENAALIRDLALVKSQRDNLQARKAVYKSRLIEREELIKTLERRLDDTSTRLEDTAKLAKADVWKEMRLFAKGKSDALGDL